MKKLIHLLAVLCLINACQNHVTEKSYDKFNLLVQSRGPVI